MDSELLKRDRTRLSSDRSRKPMAPTDDVRDALKSVKFDAVLDMNRSM